MLMFKLVVVTPVFSSEHCWGLDWSFWTNVFTPFDHIWLAQMRAQLSYLAAFGIYGIFGHYRNNCRWFWQLFDFLSRPTGSSYRFFLYSMTINLLSDVQYDNLTSSLMFNDNSALMLTVLWDLLANIQFRWHIYGAPLHGW